MLNIIKAELYRIFRSKTVYITFALLIGFIALQIAGENIGSVGIGSNTPVEGEIRAIKTGNLNGMTAAKVMIMTMDNIVYFILPLFVTVAAPMFSHGTVKNIISAGMSRIKLYLTYLLLSSLFCIFTMLFFYFATTFVFL